MVTSPTARSGGSSRDPAPAEDPTLRKQTSVKKAQDNAAAQRRMTERRQDRWRKEAQEIAVGLQNGVQSGQLARAQFQMYSDGGFRYDATSASAARDDHAEARATPRPGFSQAQRHRYGTPRGGQNKVTFRGDRHQKADDGGAPSPPSSDRRCVASDAPTSAPSLAPSAAQISDDMNTQLVRVSQTPHVTSGEDDVAVEALKTATGLATPVIMEALGRSGGKVEVAGDIAMRQQEEWLDQERARKVQLQFDLAALQPAQAVTSTQVPPRANTRGAPAGPPEQRPTSTKGNFSSSGSASTAGDTQPLVKQTMTQSQRGQPGNKGPSASGTQTQAKGKPKMSNDRGGQG
jgi:hypothetical protein